MSHDAKQLTDEEIATIDAEVEGRIAEIRTELAALDPNAPDYAEKKTALSEEVNCLREKQVLAAWSGGSANPLIIACPRD
jgi:hypothetical protein